MKVIISRREIVIRRFWKHTVSENYIKEYISSQIVKSSIEIQPFENAFGKNTAK